MENNFVCLSLKRKYNYVKRRVSQLLNQDNILELLNGQEKVDVEIKQAKKGVPQSIYETYSSFSNTNGGIILLGIKEIRSKNDISYEITGVENANTMITDFWNTINSTQKVNLNILRDEDVYSLEINGKNIIVIHVPRATYGQKPIYVGNNPYSGTFKRNYEGDYHCDKDNVNAMIRDSFRESNDNEILDWLDIDDLDIESIRAYRNRFRNNNEGHIYDELSNKDFLLKMGAYRIDKKRKIEGLTAAGVLMFGKTETFNDIYLNVNLDYRDETHLIGDMRWSDRIIENGLWEKNLYNFITKVYPKLISDFPAPFHMLDTLQSTSETRLHIAAREALANSVIHADFKETSCSILIIKKADCILYSNPGLLRLPIEQIYQGGVSVPRNITLQKMFRFIGFGESAGSGYDKILAPFRKDGYISPELSENQEMRTTNLKLYTIKSELNVDEKNDMQVVLPEIQSLVYEMIAENPGSRIPEISGLSGLKKSSVDNAIRTLKKKGLIIFEGTKKGGGYYTSEE